MSTLFEGQRIVVTGITGGIAQAAVLRLLSEGAEVVVSARSQEKLQHALSHFSNMKRLSGYVMDLEDEGSIQAFFEKVGQFDHLVTPAASSMMAPISSIDLAKARELVDTKQWGQLLCVHHALPYIRKDGSITLFSGTVTQKPLAGASMFAAVGAASEAAGRIWAFELAPLRVNTVVPGVVDTPVWESLTGNKVNADAQLQAIGSSLPTKCVGTPDDIAKAVSFLIDNTFVNGISLVVDGGHRLI